MKVFIIILVILGLLKVVSFFILLCVELYYKIKRIEIDGIVKTHSFYIIDSFILIPTIKLNKYSKYYDIVFEWLCFQYYSNYYVDRCDES